MAFIVIIAMPIFIRFQEKAKTLRATTHCIGEKSNLRVKVETTAIIDFTKSQLKTFLRKTRVFLSLRA